jgi:hypothetical protein
MLWYRSTSRYSNLPEMAESRVATRPGFVTPLAIIVVGIITLSGCTQSQMDPIDPIEHTQQLTRAADQLIQQQRQEQKLWPTTNSRLKKAFD